MLHSGVIASRSRLSEEQITTSRFDCGWTIKDVVAHLWAWQLVSIKKSWSEVYRNWKNGFLRFLELGDRISERDLLDGDRYPWLKGYSLAFILVASYDHHQEQLEKSIGWLHEHGN